MEEGEIAEALERGTELSFAEGVLGEGEGREGEGEERESAAKVRFISPHRPFFACVCVENTRDCEADGGVG